jgi:hypothetical protein
MGISWNFKLLLVICLFTFQKPDIFESAGCDFRRAETGSWYFGLEIEETNDFGR